MLKRLVRLIVALVFVVGTTVPTLPHAAMAMTSATDAPCTMAPGDNAQKQGMPAGAPCQKKMPGCVGAFGCAGFIDLASPITSASPVDWTFIAWTAGDLPLAGSEVEPELSPPIRLV